MHFYNTVSLLQVVRAQKTSRRGDDTGHGSERRHCDRRYLERAAKSARRFHEGSVSVCVRGMVVDGSGRVRERVK